MSAVTPESGHVRCISLCLLWANIGAAHEYVSDALVEKTAPAIPTGFASATANFRHSAWDADQIQNISFSSVFEPTPIALTRLCPRTSRQPCGTTHFLMRPSIFRKPF
jgi:hypothetical protein